MKIGELADRSGVSAKTIRYYESVGLIPPAARTDSGYRHYGADDVRLLLFIQRSRSLGFGTGDIRELLNLWQDHERASADVKAIASRHIETIGRKIVELRSIQDALENLVVQCHGDERPNCPIIEQLAGLSANQERKALRGEGLAAGSSHHDSRTDDPDANSA